MDSFCAKSGLKTGSEVIYTKQQWPSSSRAETCKSMYYLNVMTSKSCVCAFEACERYHQQPNKFLWNYLILLRKENQIMNRTWAVFFSLLRPFQGSLPGLLKLSLFSYGLVEHLAEHTITFSNQKHALKLVIQHGGLVHDVLARFEPTNLQHRYEKLRLTV